MLGKFRKRNFKFKTGRLASWSFRRFWEFSQELKDERSRIKKIEILKKSVFDQQQNSNSNLDTLEERVEILKMLTSQFYPPYQSKPLNLNKNVLKDAFFPRGYKNRDLHYTPSSQRVKLSDTLDLIKDISEVKGMGSDTKKEHLLSNFLTLYHHTQEEKKLLFNILSGSSRTGISLRSIQSLISNLRQEGEISFNELKNFEENFFGYHVLDTPKLVQYYDQNEEREVSLPFIPMLARSLDSTDDVKKFGLKVGEEFFVEYKYDGERIQIHYDSKSKGKKLNLFSRNLECSEKKYQQIYWKLLDVLDGMEGVESCILDGEIVPYDFENCEILPFSEILKMEKKGGNNDYGVTKIYLFDVLKYNGRYLLDEDIEKRNEILKNEIFPEYENNIEKMEKEDKILSLVKQFKGNLNSPTFEKDVQNWWKIAKSEDYEGIMIKPIGPKSQYIANNRSLWIKLKRESDEYSAADNLDLVVMGAYKGKGKRKEVYGSFLMGVYDPLRDEYWPITK